MTKTDVITVGLSRVADEKLNIMKEDGIFAEKLDGYRFAIALALASGAVPGELSDRNTFVNVGSLDPEQHLRHAVEILMPTQVSESTVYRIIERLAEWGVTQLDLLRRSGDIDFVHVLEDAELKAQLR